MALVGIMCRQRALNPERKMCVVTHFMYKPVGLVSDSDEGINLQIMVVNGTQDTLYGVWDFCILSSLDRSQSNYCCEQYVLTYCCEEGK